MIRATIRRYRDAFSGLPREVWLLALALFVNRSGAMVMTFMTLYLTSQRGMSDAAAGRMVSVYGLGAVCGAFWGGRVSQRMGGVRLQTICLFLAVPGYFVLPVWGSWPGLAASLFVLSVINEAVRPANAVAITSLTTPEVRTRALSLNRLAANLGFSFGPMIGGVLATIDFRLLFLVDGLTTLAAAGLLLWFFRMQDGRVAPPQASVRKRGQAPSISRKHRFSSSSSGSQSPFSDRRLQLSPVKDRLFVLVMALMLVNLVVFVQFGATYPLYLRDHYGFSKRAIGAMFAVNTATIVLVEMVLLDAIKHWPLLRTIGWGCLLSCVGFGILPFGSSVLYAAGAMLVVTVGEMLSFPITAGFTANRSTRGNEGAYMGWYALVFAAASVLGPTIGSAIYERNADAVWMW
jgi:predicted MFS family arabinose efflux permease